MASNPSVSFVNLYGTTKPDKETARAIRANAMGWHQRNKYAKRQKQNRLRDVHKSLRPRIEESPQSSPARAEPSLSQASGLIPSEKAVSQTTGSYRCVSVCPNLESTIRRDTHVLRGRRADVSKVSIEPGLGSSLHGSVPFDVLPIPLRPRVHQLLHDGGANTVRTSVHEDNLDSFKSQIGSSYELLCVTLSYFAAREASKDRSVGTESVMYLHEAISAINSTLAQTGGRDIPTGTVAAVACLANMENLNGDRSRALIHLNGLKQMVELKGGLESLCINRVLRRLILWADLCNATRWNSTPRFPFVPFPDLLPLSSFYSPGTEPPTLLIDPTLTDAALNSGNGRLLPLLRELHSLAAFIDHTAPYGIVALEQASYPDRAYMVEYVLLDLISHSHTHPPTTSPTHHVTGAVGIIAPLLHALLLYIYSNIRLTPVGGRIRRTLASRLRAFLEGVDLANLHSILPHLVVWILIVGGIGAGRGGEGGGDRGWFAMCLRKVWQQQLELEEGDFKAGGWSWDEILRGLKTVLWLERGFAEGGKEFWEEEMR